MIRKVIKPKMKGFYLIIGCIIFHFISPLNSQHVYINKVHQLRYYDPTVNEASYKSLPHIPIRATLNHHPHKSNYFYNANSIRYGYHPSPTNTMNGVTTNPQISIKETPSKIPSRFRSPVAFEINKSIKKPKDIGIENTNKQSKYIDIIVSCKYNITTCAPYSSSTLDNKNKNRFKTSSKQKYAVIKSQPLIRQDFMPIFDELAKHSDQRRAEQYQLQDYSINSIGSKNEIEQTPIKMETNDGSTFTKSYHYDPTKTLFRHSFDKYEPDVHKYIFSNMRIMQ